VPRWFWQAKVGSDIGLKVTGHLWRYIIGIPHLYIGGGKANSVEMWYDASNISLHAPASTILEDCTRMSIK
jgi:hypothetical protein